MKPNKVFCGRSKTVMVVVTLVSLALVASAYSFPLQADATPNPTLTVDPQTLAVITPENASKVEQLARLDIDSVRSIAISHDSETLALANGMGVSLYRVNALEATPLTIVSRPPPDLAVEGGCVSVALSPDGKLVACGNNSTTVQLWNRETGLLQDTLQTTLPKNDFLPVFSTNFSPDGKLVVAAVGRNVWLWDVATGAVRSWQAAFSPILLFSVAFSPDGKRLASGSCAPTGYADLSRCNLGEIRLWDVATGAAGAVLEGHSGWVSDIAFSPDGKLLASRSIDSTVLLWDLAAGKTVDSFTGQAEGVTSMTFSPDGKLLAYGNTDNAVLLLDVTTDKLQNILTSDSKGEPRVVFSPDGKLLISASTDKTLRFWGVRQ